MTDQASSYRWIEGQGSAFGWPGVEPRWTSARKDAVGMAYSASSRIWYTISHGILNEIYYPTIDRPQTRDMEFLLTDWETFVHEAHAVDMGLVNDNAATVVGLGSCAVQSDCTISIYGHSLPLSGYWPLLQNVPGWGIANVSGRARPNFAMHFQGGFQTAFVVARRVSANAAELMRYTVIGSGRIGITQPGDQLHADGCERISAKAGAWPTQWDPAVFVLDPTPCGADAATGAAQENR